MAKESAKEVPAAVNVVAEVPLPVTKVFMPAQQVKVFSFEQWAQVRARKANHLGGMRAFLGFRATHKYSLAAWDTIFETY